jgi:hypothetical protein
VKHVCAPLPAFRTCRYSLTFVARLVFMLTYRLRIVTFDVFEGEQNLALQEGRVPLRGSDWLLCYTLAVPCPTSTSPRSANKDNPVFSKSRGGPPAWYIGRPPIQ